ncbi:MAG TPA: CU044_5270 family protein [Streptosporangiaceae bacterium]
MNEMDLIKDFCAEEKPPRPERLAAARARVVAAIEAAAPSSPALSAPDRALRPVRRTGRGRGRRILTRPGLAISGTVAAAAAVAVIVAGVIPLGAGGTGVRLAAATVLHRAAKAALAQPTPRSNQFIYTKVRSADSRRSQTVETWLSADGSRAGAQRLTPCYQAYHRLRSCTYKVPRYRGGPSLVSYAWVKTLPTDPRALLAYLERHSGCNQLPPGNPETRGIDRYDAAYSEIYVILNTLYVLPPKLGAALFDAAAKVPGVTVLPHVVGAAGGQGIAVAMTPVVGPTSGRAYGRTRYELIFDPHTYRFIGSQAVTVAGSARETVLLASHLLKVSFTNTAPTRYTWKNSDARLLPIAPTGPGSPYLPLPPPYTWGTPACIFGSLRFY